jgi:hypothetical protein
MNFLRATPILGAVLAQALAALVVAALLSLLVGRLEVGLLLGGALVLQGGLAAVLSRAFGLAVWWSWIGLAFPFAVALALAAGSLPAWPFGLAFLLLYLFFSNTARERVPLYLTNRATTGALRQLMIDRGATAFIDLGSGLGGVVRALAGEGRTALGCETAPMAFLISAVLSKLTGRGTIQRRDIWSADIAAADLVYVFLSPEPMPAIYDKARREMKPGSLLVSNSFAVPGIDADEIWDLSDRRKTRLFLYQIKG